tara:strand:+ start:86 stop:898 length:813 start_codon:yes stop_codon:yes gene_type:complete
MKNLNITAIIQARMSSSRLPGKVLFDLAGKPIIWHIVNRLKSCKNISNIVVATSDLSSDNNLVNFCIDNDIKFFRGSLNNVLSRYTELINIYKSKYIVRITGDCPLISPNYIDNQIRILELYKADVIWLQKNVDLLEGQAVYSSELLNKVENNSSCREDLEHVGGVYISNNPEKFKIIGLDPPDELTSLKYRFSVDEEADYKFIKYIYDNLWEGKPIPLKKVLTLLRNNTKARSLNNKVKDSDINNKVKKNIRSWQKNIYKFHDWDFNGL